MKTSSSVEIIGTFPASITQKRAWFMEQIHPGHRGLNIAVRWELRGPVTSAVVEAAFQKIVDRHEVFRTRFVERDGEPVQEVLSRVDFKLNLLDIRNVPAADRERKIKQIAVESADEPFDLETAGLIRVAMVQVEAQRAALLISVHNSVFDGYSIGVLGDELGTFLEAMETGKPAVLPELSLQYGDFALWQADYEASGSFAEEEAYWTRRLDGMRYFEIPPDRPRTAQEPESRSYAADLPRDFETRLAETAKALETSIFSLGTAAFAVALERYSGRQDVSFAVQIAGRNEVDLEPLIGIFTNPLVLRFDVDPAATLSDHARTTRDVVNGALAHQMLPFDRLVQVLNPPRDPLRIPLVSIMFNLQRAFLKERKYGSIELVSVPSHSPGTLYDLNVNIVGRNSGWRLVIDYNAHLFDETTIARLSDVLLDVFDGLMHHDDRVIGAIRSAVHDASAPAPFRRVETRAETPVEPSAVTLDAPQDVAGSLRKIWAEVLGLPPTEVSGNFFDLGGYSVLALRMLAKVGERFDTRPSLYAFLADPTIEGLTGLVDPSAKPVETQAPLPPAPVAPAPIAAPPVAPPRAAPPVATAPAAPPVVEPVPPGPIWELVELRKSSPDAPVLITVNQPFMFQSLARNMVSDCAVANLSVPHSDALKTLEAVGLDKGVDDALDTVLARYAGRPMMFCGLCVDGRVGLRLAQRLQDNGQDTVLVAMIDSWAPGAVKAFSRVALLHDRWRIRFRRLRYYLGLRRKGEIGWVDVLRKNAFAARLIERLTERPARDATEVLVDDTVAVLVKQTRAYAFDRYDGEVAVFVTRSQGLVPGDGVLGWSELLPADTAAYPVNGWHGDSLMRSGFERIIGVIDAKSQRLNRDQTAKD